MECHAAFKQKDILTLATTGMNPEDLPQNASHKRTQTVDPTPVRHLGSQRTVPVLGEGQSCLMGLASVWEDKQGLEMDIGDGSVTM